MREKGLGEGDSGFMVVLNTVVELVHVNLICSAGGESGWFLG